MEPLATAGNHRWEGVLAGFNGDIVALLELDAAFAVEGAVGCGTRGHWNCDAEKG